MSSLQPAAAVTSEAGRVLRPRQRLLARAGRFLLTWGTPVAIGLFLGSVGCRTSRAAAASAATTRTTIDHGGLVDPHPPR